MDNVSPDEPRQPHVGASLRPPLWARFGLMRCSDPGCRAKFRPPVVCYPTAPISKTSFAAPLLMSIALSAGQSRRNFRFKCR